jgi:hypothetical protein
MRSAAAASAHAVRDAIPDVVYMDVRDAHAGESDQLAKLWFDGWRDAHAQIVPAELTRRRTLESFRERLEAALPDLRHGGRRVPAGRLAL